MRVTRLERLLCLVGGLCMIPLEARLNAVGFVILVTALVLHWMSVRRPRLASQGGSLQ